jgi:hypothetical protein
MTLTTHSPPPRPSSPYHSISVNFYFGSGFHVLPFLSITGNYFGFINDVSSIFADTLIDMPFDINPCRRRWQPRNLLNTSPSALSSFTSS